MRKKFSYFKRERLVYFARKQFKSNIIGLSMTTQTLWQPISFSPNWLYTSTSKLDLIFPSWERRKDELKNNEQEYKLFIKRLKRQHAIETGIVEKLYDLSPGITLTFIAEGFKENLIGEGDTNISPNKLMRILNDHLSAIDFVFELIQSQRQLTKSFILELHQLITQNQDATDTIDQFGTIKKVPLMKGKFKQLPNNPLRQDGTLIEYCPPIHVETEMEHLLTLNEELENQKIHPAIIAAWFHHCFSIIHPFQDGNGRMSRLLTSIILIKHNLLPFTVIREEKKRYIESLENADKGDFNSLVSFVCESQLNYIEIALNWEEKVEKNYQEVLTTLKSKLAFVKTRKKQIEENRERIFSLCLESFNDNINLIKNETDSSTLSISTKSCAPNGDKHYYYTSRIFEIAEVNKYFFNKGLPRGWVEVNFQVKQTSYYKLVLTLHHYGRNDSTIAIASFMEFGKKPYDDKDIITPIPINLKPFIFSIEASIDEEKSKKLRDEINNFVKEIFTIVLAQISDELQ